MGDCGLCTADRCNILGRQRRDPAQPTQEVQRYPFGCQDGARLPCDFSDDGTGFDRVPILLVPDQLNRVIDLMEGLCRGIDT